MTKLTSQVDLDIIGIDQSYQGRGVGKRLMEWGVRNADNERVEIFLHGTESAPNFYQQVRITSSPTSSIASMSLLRSIQAIRLQDGLRDPSA